MGMAASQARLLSMTARMSNNEFEQQSIAYSKQRLAENTEQINNDYLEALKTTKYQVFTGYNGTEARYEDLTYNQLTGLNSIANGKQYIVRDNKGKVLVPAAVKKAYKDNNGDFNRFLRDLGYTQSNIDVSKYAASEEAIHEAWDKYLTSVGKSINDTDDQHILGFGYKSFSNTSLDGYATYNTAYGTNENGGVNLFKDSEGYYINRSVLQARAFPDENGEMQTGVFYQTRDQEGTDNYTYLPDVSYNAETAKFTYTNGEGNEVEADVLYASEGPDGYAIISEEERDHLAAIPGSNQYKTEGGVIYSVTEDVKALNFEGATVEQRELYDYAVAITEAYYNNSTSNTSDLKYDAQVVNYYRNIFYEMNKTGYTTLEDSYALKLTTTSKLNESKNFDSEAKIFMDSDWFVRQLKAGALTLSYFSTVEKSFIGTTIDDDESICEKEDKSAIAIAEQEYKTSMDRLESQDKQFDMQLNKLETEHSALQTEYEAVQKVIKNNVEKSFNIFNA